VSQERPPEEESDKKPYEEPEEAEDDAEIVEDVPADADSVQEFFAAAFRVQTPIPPPAWMREYNEIVPGSARQMIDDMHEQSAHRRRMEEMEIRAGIANSRRGQWMGYSLTMVAVVGGLVLAYLGKDADYLWLSFGGLAALAAVFVTGAVRERRAELENRMALPARRDEPPRGEEKNSNSVND
jgi:uncharacterized membrane protein